jgi:hypothetical protein
MAFTDKEKQLLKHMVQQHLDRLRGIENSGYEDGAQIVQEKDYEYFLKKLLEKLK